MVADAMRKPRARFVQCSKTRRNWSPDEHTEQCRLIEWAGFAAAQHPKLRMLYAIPNGGARHKATAAKLKAEGVRKGVPDLCLPVARGPHHGLYIELKRRQGSYPSEEQKQWLADLTTAGYRAEVCKGWEAARDVILDYLGG